MRPLWAVSSSVSPDPKPASPILLRRRVFSSTPAQLRVRECLSESGWPVQFGVGGNGINRVSCTGGRGTLCPDSSLPTAPNLI